MNRYIFEEFHDNPALYRRLVANAHRERSHVIHQGLAWLVGHVKARLAPGSGLRPGRWIARLG